MTVLDALPRSGGLAHRLAAAHPHVRVLHRPKKSGLGAAYLAGFAWARAQGYATIVECDADGSHRPEELPRLLAALGDHDAVRGSRWVSGGRVIDWPLRRLLSRDRRGSRAESTPVLPGNEERSA